MTLDNLCRGPYRLYRHHLSPGARYHALLNRMVNRMRCSMVRTRRLQERTLKRAVRVHGYVFNSWRTNLPITINLDEDE